MSYTLDMAKKALEKMNAVAIEKKEYLTELDSAIGDADHGINMCRGFNKAMEKIGAAQYGDFGGIFKDVAMVMMSAVGGSAGPLYGTFFMKMSARLKDKNEVELAEFADAMQDGLNGLMAIGKGEPGDKTMIDALGPAIAAIKDNASAGDETAWKAAMSAAEKGMKDTIPLQAKKGRASYLGERSIGHQDPGATSACYLIESFADGEGVAR